jgi:putative aldouronate transport system permease protein
MAKKKSGYEMKLNQSTAGRVFDVFNYCFFTIWALLMMAPLLYVLVGSLSTTGMTYMKFGRFTLEAYSSIFKSARTIGALRNSIIITVVGTAIRVACTSVTAYVLSKNYLPGHKIMMVIVMFFYLFTLGLIPDYIVEANVYHLKNTWWALWLKGAIGSSNLIVMMNFFRNLPASVEESARIDGCNEAQSFVHIALPMSKAAIATFTLFYAVDMWNEYLKSIIYIDDVDKWPITVWLRQYIVMSQGNMLEDISDYVEAWLPSNAVKFATIMVSTIPIIMIYPFLQKHFAKGVLVGSIKG